MTVSDWIAITLAVVGIIIGIPLFLIGPRLKAGAEGEGESDRESPILVPRDRVQE